MDSNKNSLEREVNNVAVKKFAALAAVLCLIIILAGCGGDKMKKILTGKEAEAALQNAKTLDFTGDLDDTYASSDIVADGKIVGKVQEYGLLSDARLRVIVGGREKYYLKYVTGEPVNHKGKNPSATTYGYYNQKHKCVGYAQERLIDGKEYRFVFLDAKGKPTGSYADMMNYQENGDEATELYQQKDRRIGHSVSQLEDYVNGLFTISMKTRDRGKNLRYLDKIAVYWMEKSHIRLEYRGRLTDSLISES